jgi:hypothetical protein
MNQKDNFMGISIYYNAKRDYPLTNDENNCIEKIVKKYDMEKKKKINKGKDFYIYDYDEDEPEKVFSGSTSLDMSFINPVITAKCCIFWAKFLTEIRNTIKDAEWTVRMDEDELLWDDEKGYYLPGLEWDDKNGWHLPKDIGKIENTNTFLQNI